MKKTSLITYVLVLALLVPFATIEGAPKAKKKQIGIATYSVKGLESDIEGSLKALADYGYTCNGDIKLQCRKRQGSRIFTC